MKKDELERGRMSWKEEGQEEVSAEQICMALAPGEQKFQVWVGAGTTEKGCHCKNKGWVVPRIFFFPAG